MGNAPKWPPTPTNSKRMVLSKAKAKKAVKKANRQGREVAILLIA